MIVKNEQAVLARCLHSVKGLVDEIIVVDTGSTDQTREIAARYTQKIYDFAWIDDFSAARAPRAAARRQNTTACRKIHAKQKKCAILIAARGECDEV